MAFGGLDKYECTVSRRARRVTGRGWTRRAIFHGVPADQADRLIPAEGTYWPGDSGIDGSVLMDVDIDFDKLLRASKPNYSMVVLYYRPRTWQEWLIAHPNKGVLLCRSASRSQRIRGIRKGGAIETGADIWGNFLTAYGYDVGQANWLTGSSFVGADVPYDVIEGPDPTAGTTWHVVAGSNTTFEPMAVYTVYAILDDPNHYFYPYVSKVGHYNSNLMMHLPLWPEAQREGSWLLLEMRMQPMPGVGKLRRAEYDLMFNEKGWDQPCVSAEFTTAYKQVPVHDEDNEETGSRAVLQEVATGKTKSLELLQSANFYNIDFLLTDSWVEQD